MINGKGKVAVFTLGCKVNQYDSESLRQQFCRAGFTPVDFSQQADIYLVNSCAVTNEAARKSRQMVRRARRKNPSALVVLTGCYPQAVDTIGKGAARDRKLICRLPADLICGMQQRGEIVNLCTRMLNQQQDDNRPRAPESGLSASDDWQWWPQRRLDRFSGGQRAYVKIQEGCEEYCAYCIIPHARGPLRSRPMGEVLGEVRQLVSAGHSEIVLTGIHLAAYGRECPAEISLQRLIGLIGRISGHWRLRLSSLEPMDVCENLISLLGQSPRVAQHLHLPLQSGSDRILRKMGRPYSRDHFQSLVELARAHMPDVGLTTDIMVGFPGETEQDHRETVRFVKKMRFSRIHVFPFSARPGTRAHHMDDNVQSPIAERRRDEMLQVARESSTEFHRKQVGAAKRVLLEQRIDDLSDLPLGLSTKARSSTGDIYFGYTGNYIPTWVDTGSRSEAAPGQLVDVELREGSDRGCWAFLC